MPGVAAGTFSVEGEGARRPEHPHAVLALTPGRTRGRSFDNLIRPLQERRRDRQAEGLGGLAVDD
ncbi:MAG TPA: hypothetical protein VGP61_11080, partial [Gemmatimonadales bacterium]|nr:hypothetical protein [Gemmatimonadales bacterium]